LHREADYLDGKGVKNYVSGNYEIEVATCSPEFRKLRDIQARCKAADQEYRAWTSGKNCQRKDKDVAVLVEMMLARSDWNTAAAALLASYTADQVTIGTFRFLALRIIEQYAQLQKMPERLLVMLQVAMHSMPKGRRRKPEHIEAAQKIADENPQASNGEIARRSGLSKPLIGALFKGGVLRRRPASV
jgi:hypothetical protein